MILKTVTLVKPVFGFTVGKQYRIYDEDSLFYLVQSDDFGSPAYVEKENFSESLEISTDSARVSVPLSTIENCVNLLDSIIKPSIPYHRDQRVMMQNVIDGNSAMAEIIRHNLRVCLPSSKTKVEQDE